MSASKLAEQIGNKYLPTDNRFFRAEIEKALDEMALRVFEDTRERAAKIAADAIAPNRRDIAEAIRAMQPGVIIEAIRAMQPEAGNGK